MQARTTLLILPLLLFLGACSPHPGSGGWRATSAEPLFERLEVRFNGNADFYTKINDEAAAWRCFWSAEGNQTLELKCIQASNGDNEKEYALIVEEGGQTATLERGNNVLGSYIWQAPAPD